mmetsp:Transcript_49749/g.79257  ORF Transcript_49749/g.79257 Transcript_49749/m.79257 type:complete len:123 (+) Transcript_49749:78-446(+)
MQRSTSILNTTESGTYNNLSFLHRNRAGQGRQAPRVPFSLSAAFSTCVSWPEAGSPDAKGAAMMLCKAHRESETGPARQAQRSKISWPDAGSLLGADDIAMLCHEQNLSGCSSKTKRATGGP